MISRISESLTDKLVKNEIINKMEIDVYQFGIECFIMKACHIISYCIIAICFHKTLELLVFLIAFIPVRVYAGGYHAKTPIKCYIVSCCAIVSVMWLIHLVPAHIWKYSIILTLAVCFVLFFNVPVETSNKPLDQTEKVYYKRKANLIILIELVIVLICRMMLWNDIGFVISLALTYELGIVLLGKISLLKATKQRYTDES